MNRPFLILILILTANGFLLSNLDRNGEYAAERYLWRTNKQFNKLQKDIQNIPDQKYDEMISKYQYFIDRFSDSRLLPTAYTYLGKAYILKRDFEKAYEVLGEVPKKFPHNHNISVMAYYEMARSYINQGDIANALSTYHIIKKDYPLTDLGLKAPLLIAVLHSDNNDVEWSKKVFEDAIEYYNNLKEKYTNSIIEYNVLQLLNKCYIAKNDWRNSIETMRELLFKYPQRQFLSGKNASELIRGINGVAIGKLRDYDLAVDIYSDFIGQYPDHPLNPIMNKLIIGIKRLEVKMSQMESVVNDGS